MYYSINKILGKLNFNEPVYQKLNWLFINDIIIFNQNNEIKWHIQEIEVLFRKENGNNLIIIGKLLHFDIYLFIVQEIYENNYSNILYYHENLEYLISNFINDNQKLEIIKEPLRLCYPLIDPELDNLFNGMSI
jgi:hypothetical protein